MLVVIKLFVRCLSRLPRYEAKCVQRTCFQWSRSLCVQISREWSNPLPIYWYHSKGNWLRYNFAADSFYIMKLCSRLLVLFCRNCPKDDKFKYSIPILRKLGAAYNLGWWLVGKQCRIFINCNWTSFSISYRWATTRQNVSTLTAFWRGPIFQGKGSSLGNIFLVSRKLDTFCYLTVQTAPCYVQSFRHNIGVWQTDRRTDRRNCYS